MAQEEDTQEEVEQEGAEQEGGEWGWHEEERARRRDGGTGRGAPASIEARIFSGRVHMYDKVFISPAKRLAMQAMQGGAAVGDLVEG